MNEEKLYALILSKELTWEGLIRDIVNSEGMDPWDIDISLLVQKYLEALRKIKQMDLKISGKFLLAAAILLKMKADYLLRKKEETFQEEKKEEVQIKDNYELQPNVPLPKKRKVTIEELISSLRSALVVKERRTIRHKQREVKMKVKIKKIDLGEKIATLYMRIVSFFKKFKTNEITFSTLTPSRQREDIIWTFVPLIHLANKGKIKLRQDEQFGEIYVRQ
ncbi:MAG: segregation/condensation protein A [Nanoarchaeota archaeon]|nr:segregation/condensation protein A [Nanoarchaeota archaeon]